MKHTSRGAAAILVALALLSSASFAQGKVDIGQSEYNASCASIGSHGTREMPVRGNVYRCEDTQPAELHARIRIAAPSDYLARIQER